MSSEIDQKKQRKADVKTSEREARLAAALRDNLKRRKTQLRGKRDLAAEEALKETPADPSDDSKL